MCPVAVSTNAFIIIAGLLCMFTTEGFSSQCSETSRVLMRPPTRAHLVDEGWHCMIVVTYVEPLVDVGWARSMTMVTVSSIEAGIFTVWDIAECCRLCVRQRRGHRPWDRRSVGGSRIEYVDMDKRVSLG